MIKVNNLVNGNLESKIKITTADGVFQISLEEAKQLLDFLNTAVNNALVENCIIKYVGQNYTDLEDEERLNIILGMLQSYRGN